ncbi:MAG: signal peptidase II [Ruminococcaceae bacterium]|nr:signal peptidase II [Oscillospiraceae bacterium]
MITYILAAITGVLILLADQFTKLYVQSHFEMAKSYEFLPGLIDITYIHNDGGAWGMLGGYTWLLLSVTIVVMLVCIALLLKYGAKDKLMFWAIILVLSGGIGNMIDRIFRGGKVIDFLHFEFWPTFPVFNVADCAIVIGAALLMLYFFKGIIDEEKQKRAAVVEVTQKDENV